jgi:hypothetical protein
MSKRDYSCGVTRRLALWAGLLALLALGALAAASAGSAGRLAPPAATPAPDPSQAVHHDVSPPLRSIPPAARKMGTRDHQEHKIPVPPSGGTGNDPVRQSAPVQTAAPTPGVSFAGIAAVDSAPPDPNGAVGPSHYVQIVNESFEVFSKTGTSLYGPVTTNTLFSGFGGGCQTNNDGDATVVYDRLANRFIISQFSVSTTPYLQCVAVSTSGDPTGSYYRYSFQYSNFPDYPKLGVWPDAYYETFNLFDPSNFVGPEVCAYNRAKMLLGQAATQQCYILSSTYGGLLPSDLDGSTPPPAGSPNFILNFGTNSLHLWKFHVDWTTPANSTLTGPTSIPVAAFATACSGGTCIPQSQTTQQLDSLGDRLMYRLAYRNFGDHESLVVNHSVTTGSTVGIRWYELRSPNGTPTVYQQGTYAPDIPNYRWMGSIAMDGHGDIALGYSISSASRHPGIDYTGRLVGDPLGTMTQGESVLYTGNGSQTGGLSRWGDYSSMSIDPSDDCTFWYTNEYIPANGSFNWQTQIGSFKFPSCTAVIPGLLRVTSSPALASQILIGGVIANSWGLDWLELDPGSYTLSFTHVEGYTEPAPQMVTITAGQTTTVNATFTQRGSLRVITSPAVAGAISVDGVPRNDWGLWTDLPTGSHQVCFGAVKDFDAPACQTVSVNAGLLTTVTGTYTSDPGAAGQSGKGLLRVTSSPALASQILIGGVIANSWGLDWLELDPGSYTLSFTHVEGYTEPAPQMVTITAGQTTTVNATFTQRGSLRVITSPAVPGTISVDGIPRNDWGMWTDIPTGSHQVCFGAVPGHTAPGCQTVTVNAGLLTTVTGTYS